MVSETKMVSGTIVSYICNEGFFASGPNSENLQTECLSDRSYSRGIEELATCNPIGLFV